MSAPMALDMQVGGTKDEPLHGVLLVESAGGPPSFHIVSGPSHGALDVDRESGIFTYTPAADFVGTDSFQYAVAIAAIASTPATVTIEVSRVPEAVRMDPIPDTSAPVGAGQVLIALGIQAPDGAVTSLQALVTDSTVAEAVADAAAGTLTLIPKTPGTTTVTVTATDGSSSASEQFAFSVQGEIRQESIAADPATDAVVIDNPSAGAVEFELVHNGHRAFTSLPEVVQAVQDQPDEQPDEPFGRKLWRFLRDNTYHWYPVNTELWINATWPTLNSMGWGFCSQVASAFVQIAAAAGYTARTWELNGHVVPEIYSDGAWHMYDTDLAVYYLLEDGTVAGAEDLQLRPALITSPTNPIFTPGANDPAYGNYLAGIYASTADNYLDQYAAADPYPGSRVELPPGARLIYPGRWTPTPLGYDGLLPTPYPSEYYREARLEIPAGYVGVVHVPWVLWDVQGTGTVVLAGREFTAGTGDVSAFLARPGQPVSELAITRNPGGVALVMLVNPLWYQIETGNKVEMEGTDVWSLRVTTLRLPESNRPSPPVPPSMQKPRP